MLLERSPVKTPPYLRTRPPATHLAPSIAAEALEPRIALSTVFALDDQNNILRFQSATPSQIEEVVPIIGLGAGETLLSIDFSLSSGELYGLSTAGDIGRLYRMSVSTGAAELVGTLAVVPL